MTLAGFLGYLTPEIYNPILILSLPVNVCTGILRSVIWVAYELYILETLLLGSSYPLRVTSGTPKV